MAELRCSQRLVRPVRPLDTRQTGQKRSNDEQYNFDKIDKARHMVHCLSWIRECAPLLRKQVRSRSRASQGGRGGGYTERRGRETWPCASKMDFQVT